MKNEKEITRRTEVHLAYAQSYLHTVSIRNCFWEAVREGERSRNCFRSIDAKLFLLTELKAPISTNSVTDRLDSLIG